MSSVVELSLTQEATTNHGVSERPIDRLLLLELAPDREELLMSGDIESIRNALKLDVADDRSQHWLLKRVEQERVKVINTVRRSSLVGPKKDTDIGMKVSDFVSAVENSLTGGPALGPLGTGDLRLSSPQICVSPRPLGPTHTLVVYSDNPTPTGVYPRTIELPIDDLLFAAHCPNLSILQGNSRLPLRRAGELPRVLLRVRDLATFPALVTYMHTRDRGELVRALTPQWIMDILRPLMREKKTRTFDAVARELGKYGNYDELIQAGAVISGLRLNLIDIGLKEPLLDAEVELIIRVLVKAVNYNTLAGADDVEEPKTIPVKKVLRPSRGFRFFISPRGI